MLDAKPSHCRAKFAAPLGNQCSVSFRLPRALLGRYVQFGVVAIGTESSGRAEISFADEAHVRARHVKADAPIAHP